jgi:hypothetical protein
MGQSKQNFFKRYLEKLQSHLCPVDEFSEEESPEARSSSTAKDDPERSAHKPTSPSCPLDPYGEGCGDPDHIGGIYPGPSLTELVETPRFRTIRTFGNHYPDRLVTIMRYCQECPNIGIGSGKTLKEVLSLPEWVGWDIWRDEVFCPECAKAKKST